MPKRRLPQQNTINQYIADGKTSAFNYTYLILIDQDIAVYVTYPGDEANPDKDLQVLNQDYTVQQAGTITGGTITFTKNKIPPSGSIVTLVRRMQVGIETEFGNAQSFNGHTLDTAFERVLLIMQQFQTQLNTNALQYIINSYVQSNLDNKLPVLTTQDNQVWVSQGGNIIAAQIESTDVSTLRSELASQAPNGGDGTSLVGYYSAAEKKGLTLQTLLKVFEQKIAQLQKQIAILSEASIQRGDFILTGAHITERRGFLLMDGRAISRVDYASLFQVIGTQFGSGDGTTTFNIPNFSRRTLVGSGGTATPVLNNTVGSIGGEEAHKMTIDELVAHTHSMSAFVIQHQFQNGPNDWSGEHPDTMLLNDHCEGKSLRFLDMIPKRCIKHINNQDMTIQLINGAVIRVLGSDIDPDKLRGVNVLGAVFSEYAFSDPRVLHILMPVFRQNNGWFILQTTFNGMNHAYRYFQSIKTNPAWVWRVDSVESLMDDSGNRYISDEMIEEDRKAGMPEFLIQQEYYSIITVQHERLYFSKEMQNLDETKKIILELILPNVPVYAFYDLGVNDSTAVILAQFDHLNNPYIIHFIEANNHPIQYYLNEAHRFCNKHYLRLHSHFLPHDGKNRDKATTKSTQDILQELGEAAYCVPKPQRKIDAINLMRRMLYRTKFNKENTERLIDCLSNYSKIFDEKNNIYKDQPLHDWTSHAVDAYQTLTLAIDHQMIQEIKPEIVYYV